MNLTIANWFKQLNARDRIAVVGLLLFLSLLAIYHFGLGPLLAARAGLLSQTAVKKQMIHEMAALTRQYRELRTSQQTSAADKKRRSPDFRLFSFLDRLAGETGVKQRIVYMKPSSVTSAGGQKSARVEMKCDRITMEQLTAYLYQVESSPNQVRAVRLSLLKDRGEDALMDAVMQFEANE